MDECGVDEWKATLVYRDAEFKAPVTDYKEEVLFHYNCFLMSQTVGMEGGTNEMGWEPGIFRTHR